MDKTSLTLMIGGIAFLVMLAMLWKVNDEQRQKEELQLLKETYEKALRDRDVETAAEYGRKYYIKLHRGVLTLEDEATIIREVGAITGDDNETI